MKEESNFFTYGLHRLHYRIFGRGTQPILLFHGYGQDHRVYRELARSLGNRYTLYCFDLFYHGKSSHPSLNELISADEWSDIIRRFLDRYQMDHVSLLGYSMGGRFALSLVANLNEMISELILIAPDGIQSGGWYRMGSATWLGRTLLRRTIVRPKTFFNLVNIARKYSVAHRSTLKFAEKHMRNSRDRYRVYRCWAGLRRVQPQLPRVIKTCNQYSIPVQIYLGKYDRVINSKSIINFHNSLANSRLHLLPCGHNSLIQAVSIDLPIRF